MANRFTQIFPALEKALKEYGDPIHYEQLSELTGIPAKNVSTALAYHTRNFPLGTVRRVKRGTYVYTTPLRRRTPPSPDQPPLFKGPVTQEEIDAKTHPAQRAGFVPDMRTATEAEADRQAGVVNEIRSFGDTLTASEKNAFRDAAGLTTNTPGSIGWDGVDRVGDKLADATIVHIENGDDDGRRDVFFTWRGRMWKAFVL